MLQTQASSSIKAGIVTLTVSDNYGGILQRYALQRTLQNLGVDVECLIFSPPHTQKRSIKDRLERLFSIERLRRDLRKTRSNVFYRRLEKKYKKQRTAVFEDFAHRFLTSTKRLQTYEEVIKEGECFDVLIAGSDQIWNSDWYRGETFYKFYMLDFVQREKKISYAASLGLSQLPEEVVPKYRKYLSDFSWISVRENEGARILEGILNRPIDVVLDPTMLVPLEEWDALTSRVLTNEIRKFPYVLCYSLDNQKEIVRKARQIQKFREIPILYACATASEYESLKRKSDGITPIPNVAPDEFVLLFQNADCVVTDSFHGSVFSILFHKPFFTMMRDKRVPTKSMNSRMTTLFSTFRLESRLFSPEDKSPLTPKSFEIGYETVDKILQERRKYSLRKLQEALENVVKRNANA